MLDEDEEVEMNERRKGDLQNVHNDSNTPQINFSIVTIQIFIQSL